MTTKLNSKEDSSLKNDEPNNSNTNMVDYEEVEEDD